MIYNGLYAGVRRGGRGRGEGAVPREPNDTKCSSCHALTDHSDHPHQHVCEARDPHGRHEERYHEPLPPEAPSAVRYGEEQKSDDGQRQNPQYPFQIALWHGKHAPAL